MNIDTRSVLYDLSHIPRPSDIEFLLVGMEGLTGDDEYDLDLADQEESEDSD